MIAIFYLPIFGIKLLSDKVAGMDRADLRVDASF
jgi:hypothetical protein